MAGTKYRVRCIGRVEWGKDDKGFEVVVGESPRCGWSGVRSYHVECECYDIWRLYCRPLSPGPGCPSGIDWPCPRCKGAVKGNLVTHRAKAPAVLAEIGEVEVVQ